MVTSLITNTSILVIEEIKNILQRLSNKKYDTKNEDKYGSYEHGCINFIRDLYRIDKSLIVEEIINNLEDFEKNYRLFVGIDMKKYEKTSMLSLFILKSLCIKSNSEWKESILVINDVLEFYTKFMVYYGSTRVVDEKIFKREVFRCISKLILSGVVSERKIWMKNNTKTEWSLEVFVDEDLSTDLQDTPYTCKDVSGKKYLIGNFFTRTYELYKENIKSGEVFELKDTSFLEKQLNIKVYYNPECYSRIKKRLEKFEQIDLCSIDYDISEINRIISEKTRKMAIIVRNKRENFNRDKVISERRKASMQGLTVVEYLENKLEIKYKRILRRKDSIINLLKIIVEDNIKENIDKFKSILAKEIEVKNTGKHFKKILGLGEISRDDKILDTRDIENKIYSMSFLEKLTLYKEKDLNNLIKEKILKIENSRIYDRDTIDNELIIDKLILYSIDNEDIIEDYYFDKEDSIRDIKDNIKELQKRVSKLIIYRNFRMIEDICSEDVGYYIPFFFDFRGRLYYISNIGPTSLKMSRYLINYGCTYKLPKVSIVDQLISENITKMDEIANMIGLDDREYYNKMFWCCIALGKVYIKKNKYKIDVDVFLNEVINVLSGGVDKDDLIDMIESDYYLNILKNIKDNRINWLIQKDATASFLQILVRILGEKNNESLLLTNMGGSNSWYDTYSYILSRWKEIENNDEKLIFFNRKTVKKSIMTNPYSAKYRTSLEYFAEEVRKQFNVDVYKDSELEKNFKKFFDFISNDLETEIFLKKSSKELIVNAEKLLSNSNLIIEYSDSKTNMIYYKMKQKTWDIIINIKDKRAYVRRTKKYEEVDRMKVDRDKVIQAVRANWVHYHDGLILREVIKRCDIGCITIHDCFLVEMDKIDQFILIYNDVMLGDTIFKKIDWVKNSIFIII